MSTRAIAQLIETIHAPVHFAPEPGQAYVALGLRGYWRGYFASRSAALGIVPAATVTELFGGFAPPMVARAVDEIWTITTPAKALEARHNGATQALVRLGIGDTKEAAALLRPIVAGLDLTDSPMAAAHAAVPLSESPVTALWQLCIVLREYRGDAHLAVVGAHVLPWPQPHLLLEPTGLLDPNQREFRGWSEDDWSQARESLNARGLYDSAAGLELISEIDAETDWLVEPAFYGHQEQLIAVLSPLAMAVRAAIPFPNAMGLPQPEK